MPTTANTKAGISVFEPHFAGISPAPSTAFVISRDAKERSGPLDKCMMNAASREFLGQKVITPSYVPRAWYSTLRFYWSKIRR